MDLKELLKESFEGSDLHCNFASWYDSVGEDLATEYKITLLAPMRENIDWFIKSQGRLMESFATGDNTPYTAEEMDPNI
jgi:hypothetical protein